MLAKFQDDLRLIDRLLFKFKFFVFKIVDGIIKIAFDSHETS